MSLVMVVGARYVCIFTAKKTLTLKIKTGLESKSIPIHSFGATLQQHHDENSVCS